jgi:hypothetical protein
VAKARYVRTMQWTDSQISIEKTKETQRKTRLQTRKILRDLEAELNKTARDDQHETAYVQIL